MGHHPPPSATRPLRLRPRRSRSSQRGRWRPVGVHRPRQALPRAAAREPLQKFRVSRRPKSASEMLHESRRISGLGCPTIQHAPAKSKRAIRVLHGMRRFVPAQRTGQIILDFLLGVAAILVAELHADPGGALALRAFRRHPNDSPRDRKLLFFAHQIEQHEYFIAQTVVAVGRNEQTAVFHERHVREVERALILDREGQQPGFITWTSQFLPFPQNTYLDKAARPPSSKASSASC
jgi:hypothetical protein